MVGSSRFYTGPLWNSHKCTAEYTSEVVSYGRYVSRDTRTIGSWLVRNRKRPNKQRSNQSYVLITEQAVFRFFEFLSENTPLLFLFPTERGMEGEDEGMGGGVWETCEIEKHSETPTFFVNKSAFVSAILLQTVVLNTLCTRAYCKRFVCIETNAASSVCRQSCATVFRSGNARIVTAAISYNNNNNNHSGNYSIKLFTMYERVR